MTSSVEPHGDGLPGNLPLLTEVADTPLPDELPTLTEVVVERQAVTGREAPAPEAAMFASCAPDDGKMQQLLQRLETHLENVFAHRLNLALEQQQRQAVGQAVGELKAELPELLREALTPPDSPR